MYLKSHCCFKSFIAHLTGECSITMYLSDMACCGNSKIYWIEELLFKNISNFIPNAFWLGETLSHCGHFWGPELCLVIWSFNVYRLLSQASQISHCTRVFRIELSVCMVRTCESTSCLVANLLAQYSQISFFSSFCFSWIRNVCDFCDSSVENLMDIKVI